MQEVQLRGRVVHVVRSPPVGETSGGDARMQADETRRTSDAMLLGGACTMRTRHPHRRSATIGGARLPTKRGARSRTISRPAENPGDEMEPRRTLWTPTDESVRSPSATVVAPGPRALPATMRVRPMARDGAGASERSWPPVGYLVALCNFSYETRRTLTDDIAPDGKSGRRNKAATDGIDAHGRKRAHS